MGQQNDWLCPPLYFCEHIRSKASPLHRHHLGNLVLFLQYKNPPLFHATIVRFGLFSRFLECDLKSYR